MISWVIKSLSAREVYGPLPAIPMPITKQWVMLSEQTSDQLTVKKVVLLWQHNLISKPWVLMWKCSNLQWNIAVKELFPASATVGKLVADWNILMTAILFQCLVLTYCIGFIQKIAFLEPGNVHINLEISRLGCGTIHQLDCSLISYSYVVWLVRMGFSQKQWLLSGNVI